MAEAITVGFLASLFTCGLAVVLAVANDQRRRLAADRATGARIDATLKEAA